MPKHYSLSSYNRANPSNEEDNYNLYETSGLEDRVPYKDHLGYDNDSDDETADPSSSYGHDSDLLGMGGVGVPKTHTVKPPKISPESLATAQKFLWDEDGNTDYDIRSGSVRESPDSAVTVDGMDPHVGLSPLQIPAAARAAHATSWLRRQSSKLSIGRDNQVTNDADSAVREAEEYFDEEGASSYTYGQRNSSGASQETMTHHRPSVSVHRNNSDKGTADYDDNDTCVSLSGMKAYRYQWCDRKRMIKAGAALAVFAIFLGFLISATSSKKNGSPAPYGLPDTPLDIMSEYARMMYLRELLLTYDKSDEFAHATKTQGTPQYRALSWFASRDYKSGFLSESSLVTRFGLATFFEATGGHEWTNRHGWLGDNYPEDFDVCRWYGITCDSNSRIVSLDLSNNNLNGSVPRELRFTLGRVKTLDLSLNDLIFVNTTRFESIWETATELETLRLARTGLVYQAAEKLYGLSNLVTLDLRDNSLSGYVPVSESWTKLETLQLDSNFFYYDIPEMTALTNLAVLTLSGNQLSGSFPEWALEMPSLRDLRLSSNQFTGTIPTKWESNLVHFEIAANHFDENIPNMFGNWKSLSYFSASYNNFTGPIPISLGELGASLQDLHLEHNKLTGQIPNTLGNCSILKTLKLDTNDLDGTIPTGLANIQSLVQLDLHTNWIQDAMPAGMCELENLKTLTADCLPPKEEGWEAEVSCDCCSCF